MRHEMKQRIKQGVPEEQRVVIKITPEIEENAEMFTRMHSREFRFMGEMYDVLHSEKSGDTTLYTCIHDVKESGLFNDLDRLVIYQINHNPHERESRELAFSFFNQHYLPLVESLVREIGVKVSTTLSSNHNPLLGFSSEHFRPPIG